MNIFINFPPNFLGGYKNEMQTDKLINSLMSSDLDGDGTVSKYEVLEQQERLEEKISYLNMIKSFFPRWGRYLDAQIELCERQLAPLSLVSNNYDAFSKNGESKDRIDFADLMNVIEAAYSDGNAEDFSDEDLEYLKNASLA